MHTRLPRVMLSSSATTVASWLLGMPSPVTISDELVARSIGVEPDTVYRALIELERVGAVTLGRARGERPVELHPSWVWDAVRHARALAER